MNCEDTREKLSALDVADFSRIAHLADCEDCRRFAALAADAEQHIAAHVDDFASRVSFDDALRQLSTPIAPRRIDMPQILHTAVIALASAAALAVAVSPMVAGVSERAASVMRVNADAQDTWLVQVSARELQAGHTITAADVYAIEIPKDNVPDGTFPVSTSVVGKAVTAPILANELFSCKRLNHCEGAISESPQTASWKPTALLPEGTALQILAVRPLPVGHVIQRSDLYAVEMPENLIPPTSFTDWDAMIGITVTGHIFADEPVRCERLNTQCP